MQLSYRNEKIPEWAREYMLMICPYCGADILDNGEDGFITARCCLNPYCPGHMMHKLNRLLNHFGAKDIGPKTCEKLIKANKFKSHFDAMPIIFDDIKPEVSLAELADLACIEGYGMTQAQKDLNSYALFNDYFDQCPMPNVLLLENKEILIKAQEYFRIKPPRSRRKLYVMGTGSFNGYANREEYFTLVNAIFGSYIDVIQTGKRKTGISYLIKETNAVDHSKSQIARECGIPIVTPDEFISILHLNFPYALDKVE